MNKETKQQMKQDILNAAKIYGIGITGEIVDDIIKNDDVKKTTKLIYWHKRTKLLDENFVSKVGRYETDLEKQTRLDAKIKLNDKMLKQCRAWKREGLSLELIAVKRIEKYGVEMDRLNMVKEVSSSRISRMISGK